MHSTEYQQAFWCSVSWDSQIVKEKNTHWHFSIETFLHLHYNQRRKH